MNSADRAKNQAVLAYLQRLEELNEHKPEKKSFMDHLERLLRRSRDVPLSRVSRAKSGEFVAAVRAEHEARLCELVKNVPDAHLGRVLETPVLVTPVGRVFAIMGGASDLILYLPDGETWGREYPEIGELWRRWYAWPRLAPERDSYEQQLASMLRLSYSTAMQADVVA